MSIIIVYGLTSLSGALCDNVLVLLGLLLNRLLGFNWFLILFSNSGLLLSSFLYYLLSDGLFFWSILGRDPGHIN